MFPKIFADFPINIFSPIHISMKIQLKKLSFACFVCFLLTSFSAFSQKGIVQGTVKNAKSLESLIGVTVVLDSAVGAVTDLSGFYRIEAEPGDYHLSFSAIGYEKTEVFVTIKAGETQVIDITQAEKSHDLGIVVIGGSKYERRLEEEVVSIDVLKADAISNSNAKTLDEALQKIPGLYMLDNQLNLRGGTSYSYGAGSRVMMVVDDVPLISPFRGDIQWNLVPLENVEQVEVIKGASSVLYGSAAMNGVVHIRTADPTETPHTSLQVYHGFYGTPQRAETQWWNSSPMFTGGSVVHLRKIGDFDLTVAGSFASDNSYLKGELSEHARLNFKTRYRPPIADGRLAFGINGNVMYFNEGNFIIWENSETGALQPYNNTLQETEYLYAYIDPYLTYFDKKENKHTFKTRFYNITSHFSPTNRDRADLLTGEYQFAKDFKKGYHLITGVSGMNLFLNDLSKPDPEKHGGFLGGIYAQANKDFDRLSLSLGLRWELFGLDTIKGVSTPIVKAGLSYAATPTTFLRSSFGHGYRFPSVAERFVDTDLNNEIFFFPNPELQPELGWNAEAAVKQTFTIGDWKGYADLAAYWTEYKDMIEAKFLFLNGNLSEPGFQFVNVGPSRVTGYELTLSGDGKIGNFDLFVLAGYTYAFPVDLTADTTLVKPGKYLSTFFRSITNKDADITNPMLKYRYRHTAKLSIESAYRRFSAGADIQYYSYMEKIDAVFEQLLDLVDYRRLHNKGSTVIDGRVGYDLNDKSRISFMVKNLLNREYALRPAKLEAPRNFTVQYKLSF